MDDRTAITNVLEQYLAGGRSGKSADMQSAFWDGATIAGYVGDELFAGPIEHLYSWIDENPPAAEMTGTIASIDIAESVATARIEADNWGGHRFTDMFTLLRLKGEWKITSKVFHLHG